MKVNTNQWLASISSPELFLLEIKINSPVIAATVDAINILSLELFTSVVSVKARLLINIDMVKPIPPRKPIPKRFFHVIPSCSRAKPAVTKIKGIENIPISLPAVRPKIIPNELGEERLPEISEGIIMAVFTNAKIGTIIKATGLCKKCWS